MIESKIICFRCNAGYFCLELDGFADNKWRCNRCEFTPNTVDDEEGYKKEAKKQTMKNKK